MWPTHDFVFSIHETLENFLQFVSGHIVLLVMWICRGNCQTTDVSELILHLRTRGVLHLLAVTVHERQLRVFVQQESLKLRVRLRSLRDTVVRVDSTLQ